MDQDLNNDLDFVQIGPGLQYFVANGPGLEQLLDFVQIGPELQQ